MSAAHWIVLSVGVVNIALMGILLYFYFMMHKAIRGIMEYHCDFAGSHDRLERWVKGINRDMNTIAAAITRDREQLAEHDVRVVALTARADEIMNIMMEIHKVGQKDRVQEINPSY